MTTIEPDPDIPDPDDRTMQRLELTAALDEGFPQWRSYIGEMQRSGIPLGWMDTTTAPAGVELANIGEDEQNPDAAPLTWQSHQGYLILRTSEAPEQWVRAVRRRPLGYDVEAVLLTRELEPERGTRRWQVITADDTPARLTDHTDGGEARPWVLREDTSYDLEHDLEGGWQIFGHDGGSLVPRPAS
uniref:hypothetical protein n=1 Tax=Amycolatopsis sp. CA-096443 TaxID=3239919 RepID=UPI003F496A9E